MEEYTITIKKKISQQNVDDLMVTALEGGITYWADSAEAIRRKGSAPQSFTYTSEALTRGYDIIITADGVRHRLTLPKLLNGIKKHGKLDLDDMSDFDANDADAVVQYAIFGEVVYG